MFCRYAPLWLWVRIDVRSRVGLCWGRIALDGIFGSVSSARSHKALFHPGRLFSWMRRTDNPASRWCLFFRGIGCLNAQTLHMPRPSYFLFMHGYVHGLFSRQQEQAVRNHPGRCGYPDSPARFDMDLVHICQAVRFLILGI